MIQVPSYIYLYSAEIPVLLNLSKVSVYLKKELGKSIIEIRENFLTYWLKKMNEDEKDEVSDSISAEFAKSKVSMLDTKDKSFDPMPAEIAYEKRRLSGKAKGPFGILYDGMKLITIFLKVIPRSESGLKHCHIIFTNQLFGTWSENDLRYHARAAIYGFPSIISLTGIVEAPAKPKEFYLKRHLLGGPLTPGEEFRERFIDHDDPRLTRVVKGYCMQALFYHMTGKAFCKEKNCRLYNAHWQEELIFSQVESGAFCKRHDEILKMFRKNTIEKEEFES